MKSSLEGKRLLILNGNFISCDIVEKCRELGVYSIVTDWYEDAPAKRIADEAYNLSIADTPALVSLARTVKADGIYTQYTDSSLPYCLKACEAMGFPFFVNAEQLEKITNKALSKQLCIDYGIPVSKRYYVSDILTDEDIALIDEWPVLTKPVDNSGQRGITICNNPDELRRGYDYAKSNSLCGKAIVEEYMHGDYMVICFTLQDGKLSLSCLADKPVISETLAHGNIRLPKGYITPSKHLDLFYQKAFPKFQKLAEGIGLKNGSWGIECVYRNGDFYVFEMQFRLGGIKHQNFVMKEHDVDLMAMHIQYALTGKFDMYDLSKLDDPHYKNIYASLNILLGAGTISEINGIEHTQTLEGVVNMNMMHKKGDIVEDTGTVFQILAKYSLQARNKAELSELIRKIYSMLSVKDQDGKSMLLDIWADDDLARLKEEY